MTDDLAPAALLELIDTNDVVQRFDVRSIRTSELTVQITSAYPGTWFGDREPFIELALEGISFVSRVAPG